MSLVQSPTFWGHLINRAIFNLKTYLIVFYNAPSVIRNTSIKSNEIYDF